ncbi:MAG TPA: hypothetical protein VJ875_04695 [Pyrinomonadaceae bacterium]|nr:hypothetical protein [Pyrinomonadaceae bacterium]
MRFILGLLVGYCIRGKQRLLIATLTAIAVGCFIVLPAIQYWIGFFLSFIIF